MGSIQVNKKTDKRMSVDLSFQRLLMLMTAIIMALVTFNACIEDDDEKLNEDGLTEDVLKILQGGYLEKIKALGMEINGGNNPPDIEGTYLVSPYRTIKSTFPGDSWLNLQMVDATLIFSEQNNSKLTVSTYFEQLSGVEAGKGTGSFITGSGNKFTVYVKMAKTINDIPYEAIYVISGEMSSSGIKNYQNVYIVTKGNQFTTLPEGEARLNKDDDGLAERIK
jgi:hypothetical protein